MQNEYEDVSFAKLCSLHKSRITVKVVPSKPQNTLLITKIQAVKCGFDSSHTIYCQQTDQRIFADIISSLKTIFLLMQKVSKNNFISLPFYHMAVL